MSDTHTVTIGKGDNVLAETPERPAPPAGGFETGKVGDGGH